MPLRVTRHVSVLTGLAGRVVGMVTMSLIPTRPQVPELLSAAVKVGVVSAALLAGAGSDTATVGAAANPTALEMPPAVVQLFAAPFGLMVNVWLAPVSQLFAKSRVRPPAGAPNSPCATFGGLS